MFKTVLSCIVRYTQDSHQYQSQCQLTRLHVAICLNDVAHHCSAVHVCHAVNQTFCYSWKTASVFSSMIPHCSALASIARSTLSHVKLNLETCRIYWTLRGAWPVRPRQRAGLLRSVHPWPFHVSMPCRYSRTRSMHWYLACRTGPHRSHRCFRIKL